MHSLKNIFLNKNCGCHPRRDFLKQLVGISTLSGGLSLNAFAQGKSKDSSLVFPSVISKSLERLGNAEKNFSCWRSRCLVSRKIFKRYG